MMGAGHSWIVTHNSLMIAIGPEPESFFMLMINLSFLHLIVYCGNRNTVIYSVC